MVSMYLVLIIGFAVFFNFAVLLRKFKDGRWCNGIIDTFVFVSVCFLFSGSTLALVIGTFASAMFSIYLYFYPVKLVDFNVKLPKFDDDWD